MRSGSDESRQAMLTPLFTPSPTTSLEGRSESRHFVILNVLDTVLAELRFWRYDKISWVLEQTYKGEGLQVPICLWLLLPVSHSDDPSSYAMRHLTSRQSPRREWMLSIRMTYGSHRVASLSPPPTRSPTRPTPANRRG